MTPAVGQLVRVYKAQFPAVFSDRDSYIKFCQCNWDEWQWTRGDRDVYRHEVYSDGSSEKILGAIENTQNLSQNAPDILLYSEIFATDRFHFFRRSRSDSCPDHEAV